MDGRSAPDPARRRGGSRLALPRGHGRGKYGLGGTGVDTGVLRAVPEDAGPRGGIFADRGARQGDSADGGQQGGAETSGACVGRQGGSRSHGSDASEQGRARVFGGRSRRAPHGDGAAEGGDG